MTPIRNPHALATALLLVFAATGAQAISLEEHPCDSLALGDADTAGGCVDADTDPCSDRDKGWGWEYPSCFFDCDPNQYVHVKASVDDGGYVSAQGKCGGATATCTDDGACSGDSPTPTTTPTRTTGTCKASTYGGWRTNGYVSCWTTDAPERVPEVEIADVLDGVAEVQIEERPRSLATISFDDGVVSGSVCGLDGACRVVQPDCVRVGELLTCVVQTR